MYKHTKNQNQNTKKLRTKCTVPNNQSTYCTKQQTISQLIQTSQLTNQATYQQNNKPANLQIKQSIDKCTNKSSTK